MPVLEKNRLCLDNIAIFHSNIYNGWYNNKDTIALFLDNKGAYDNVLWDILVKKLINLRLPPSFIKFVFNLTFSLEVQLNTMTLI